MLNVPVALNCSVMPTAIEGTAGVIAIDTSAAGVTSRVVEPVTAPELALTDVLPTATLLAIPVVLIVATPVLPLAHTTLLDMSRVLPSVYVPVA